MVTEIPNTAAKKDAYATNSKLGRFAAGRMAVRRSGHFQVSSEKFSATNATKSATNGNFREEPGNANARQRMTYADGQHAGAERGGFEPPDPISGVTSLAMMRIRPLCHLSSTSDCYQRGRIVRHMIIGSCSETSSPEFFQFLPRTE